MSISKLLNISQRSLFVYQKALEVTSNNIANASDPNFSRQRVDFTALQANTAETLAVGDGVVISDIKRLRDQFTENQIIAYTQSDSYNEKKAELLSNLESVLSEPSDLGLSNLLGEFFNAWEELSVNPENAQLRTNVVQSAENLSNKLKNIYDGFTNLRSDLEEQAAEDVDLINTYVSEIRTLNDEIFRLGVTDANSNALLDRRDELILELSDIANINVSYDTDNMANITIGGVYAVDRYYNAQFTVVENNGNLSIQTVDGTSKLRLTKGSLGAIVETANTTIPGYLSYLDSVGSSIVENVNSIHESGYTSTEPPLTGIKFFDGYNKGNLVINSDIKSDVNFIATSSDGTNGNNDIALQIAGLNNAKIINGQTLVTSYSNFVSGIGNTISMCKLNNESNSLVLQQLEQQKSSYSGVSLDEEMTNVLQFQKSYEAAAKLIKVADELFDILLNAV
jgi:flagellar hook-associated protein 1 FlgK